MAGLAGNIEVRDVDFRNENRETVLAGFDLGIAAGETVALVGHSSAGKSSIAC